MHSRWKLFLILSLSCWSVIKNTQNVRKDLKMSSEYRSGLKIEGPLYRGSPNNELVVVKKWPFYKDVFVSVWSVYRGGLNIEMIFISMRLKYRWSWYTGNFMLGSSVHTSVNWAKFTFKSRIFWYKEVKSRVSVYFSIPRKRFSRWFWY